MFWSKTFTINDNINKTLQNMEGLNMEIVTTFFSSVKNVDLPQLSRKQNCSEEKYGNHESC